VQSKQNSAMNQLKENSFRVSGSENPRQAETKAVCCLKNNHTQLGWKEAAHTNQRNAGKQTGTSEQLL